MQNVWQILRQRDFTGGETQATLPELVKRSQLLRCENVIVSPEGEITASWQLDNSLFINASTGLVIVPIPGSNLYTVYTCVGNNIISFIFDPASPTPYDLNDADGYPGFVSHAQTDPIVIQGIGHGVPFLGKQFCCASPSLYLEAGQLVCDALAFGAVQTTTVKTLNATIENATEFEVTITGVNSDNAKFGQSGNFPQVLVPGASYVFGVVYSPSAPAVDDTGNLRITSTLGILLVPLTGSSLTTKAELGGQMAEALTYTNEVQADFASLSSNTISKKALGLLPNPYDYDGGDSLLKQRIELGTLTMAMILANPGTYGGQVAVSYSAYLAIKAEYDAL